MHPVQPSAVHPSGVRPVYVVLGVIAAFAALAAVVIALLVRPVLESQLIEYEANVDMTWKEVEVQLQRQHELIPKLLQVVKGYSSYELAVIDKVVTAQQRFNQADSREQPNAAREVDAALSVVLVGAVRYPELAADGHFRDLSYELAGTKNRIAVARGRYNDAVAVLNARRRQFPWRIAADAVKERTFYEAPPETQVEPEFAL